MSEAPLARLHRLVWTALSAASMAGGALLVLPIGPVPVSLQPLFVLLAGFALGPRRGALAVGLYLLAGVAGLPVFSGGGSGLGHVLGPTGGYLLGFALTAFVAGLATRGRGELLSWPRGLLFGAAGILCAYVLGASWLARVLGLGLNQALAVGVAPFLPADGLKIVAAVACYRFLSRCNLLPEAS